MAKDRGLPGPEFESGWQSKLISIGNFSLMLHVNNTRTRDKSSEPFHVLRCSRICSTRKNGFPVSFSIFLAFCWSSSIQLIKSPIAFIISEMLSTGDHTCLHPNKSNFKCDTIIGGKSNICIGKLIELMIHLVI